jgi:hypothetical protein
MVAGASDDGMLAGLGGPGQGGGGDYGDRGQASGGVLHPAAAAQSDARLDAMVRDRADRWFLLLDHPREQFT